MVTSEELLKKVRGVLNYYKSCVVFGSPDKSVDKKYMNLFSTMKRWHKNSHISTEDWKESFEIIKHSLDVRGKMKLPENLKIYLERKFSNTGLRTRFSICEILEFLVPDIKMLFDKMQAADSDSDEFEVDKLPGQAMLPEDVTFYQKEFLPYALFLTYSQRHPNDVRESLMDDIFTIGSGSLKQDLVPEVTALCTKCAKDEEFQDLSTKDIEQFNIQILLKQIECNFEVLNASPCSSINPEIVEKTSFWFNPFSSDDSGSSFNDDEEVKHKCTLCFKEFTKDAFLAFHKEWFHKPATAVQYVDEGEELMTSFHKEGADAQPVIKKKRTEKEKVVLKKEIKKSSRFNLRK